MAGFTFVRSLVGGTTELNYHTATADADIAIGDAIAMDTAHDEVIPATDASKGILGVAVSAGADGDEIRYIPATPWNVFRVGTGTNTYTDADDRHTVCDLEGTTGEQYVTPGTAGDAQFVIIGLAPGETDNEAGNEVEVIVCNSEFLAIDGAVPA